MAGNILSIGKGELGSEQLDPIMVHIPQFKIWRTILLSDFHEALQPWRLGTLKQFLFEPKQEGQVDPSMDSFRQALSNKLHSAVTDIQKRVEELQAAQLTPASSMAADLIPFGAWAKAVALAAEDLVCFCDWIRCLLGESSGGVDRMQPQ